MVDDIHSCSYYCTRPACIEAQRNELRDKNSWRNAVDDMLVTCHEVASDDPRESINRLINWHVTISLDPTVSSAAQELIARGKEEALNESIKMFEELHERRKHMDNYALYFANLLRDRKNAR